MTVQQLAHDLAARIPDMAKDSPINNADMMERMIEECFLERYALTTENPQAGGEGAMLGVEQANGWRLSS
jgi:hypothetical protein